MKYMVIDIGSNTIKYDVFCNDDSDKITVISHDAIIVGLIGYIKNGILSEEGYEILFDTLEKFQKKAKKLECDKIISFGTASLRSCDDPNIVIERIRQKTNLKVRLISSTEESQLSLAGLFSSISDASSGVMIDSGGGSTEINIFKNRESYYSLSLPFGTLNLKIMFNRRDESFEQYAAFLNRSEINKMRNHVRQALNLHNIQNFNNIKTAYIVGGCARAMGKLCGMQGSNSTCIINPSDLNSLIDYYCDITPEKAESLIEKVPGRYYLILPAAIIYTTIFDMLKIESVVVAGGGVRRGFIEKILKEKIEITK